MFQALFSKGVLWMVVIWYRCSTKQTEIRHYSNDDMSLMWHLLDATFGWLKMVFHHQFIKMTVFWRLTEQWITFIRNPFLRPKKVSSSRTPQFMVVIKGSNNFYRTLFTQLFSMEHRVEETFFLRKNKENLVSFLIKKKCETNKYTAV